MRRVCIGCSKMGFLRYRRPGEVLQQDGGIPQVNGTVGVEITEWAAIVVHATRSPGKGTRVLASRHTVLIRVIGATLGGGTIGPPPQEQASQIIAVGLPQIVIAGRTRETARPSTAG